VVTVHPDWTVALDHALCGRLTACTGCGRRGGSGWFEVWTSADGTRTLPVALCARCTQDDPDRARLCALLERRYGR
jgi:hypothetical protein